MIRFTLELEDLLVIGEPRVENDENLIRLTLIDYPTAKNQVLYVSTAEALDIFCLSFGQAGEDQIEGYDSKMMYERLKPFLEQIKEPELRPMP